MCELIGRIHDAIVVEVAGELDRVGVDIPGNPNPRDRHRNDAKGGPDINHGCSKDDVGHGHMDEARRVNGGHDIGGECRGLGRRGSNDAEIRDDSRRRALRVDDAGQLLRGQHRNEIEGPKRKSAG